LVSIEALIVEIHAHTSVAPEKVRVTASYHASNIFGTLTFDLPIDRSGEVHVGQAIHLVVSLTRPTRRESPE